MRISSAPLPHETIILDRRVAILAGPPSPFGREYTVTTSPVLVGGVYSLFTAAWEAAARRLGTSLRTYRRRVAELMAALEAGSRFQAGMRAGELGLTH